LVQSITDVPVPSVGKVEEIAEQQRTPITTLSVACVLANPAVTSVILNARRLEQLTDTLAAADYKLDRAPKAKLDEVSIDYQAALASLPTPNRQMFDKRLHSLAFVDGITGEGTGLTSPGANSGSYDITLRASI
jgi:hypothetical protein